MNRNIVQCGCGEKKIYITTVFFIVLYNHNVMTFEMGIYKSK